MDIGGILDGWEFTPGQLSVRKIRGKDGTDKIQMRLDLGLLQMNETGRPDGKKPYGFESLLDYYEHRLRTYRDQYGTDEGFYLDERACDLLRAEAVMYYHRYLAGFVLEEFPLVERDTFRNLRLFDFCLKYAKDPADGHAMEQYRPYVMMMNARARAHHALADNRAKTALAIVRRSIRRIEDFYSQYEGEEELEDQSGELAILRGLAKEIEGQIPVDPIRHLRKELDRAIREERYEEAARLRDQLRSMRRSGGTS